MFDIDSYFQQFLKAEAIFSNRNVLRPDFVPNSLPHRDRQIKQIAEIVACALKESLPSNIFLFGKTGTGKTAVVKHVSKALNEQCKLAGIPTSKWIFLNCQQVNTGYRILAKICNELDPDNPVPIAGWPIDVVFDRMIDSLEKYVKGVCFLVLDEIDVLVKNTRKSKDSILYNLVRINERLKKAQVSLIGISNVLNFKALLDPRVLSSLGQEEIVFPAYNAMELRDILAQRASLAFHPGALEEEVIPLCGALAAREHGDARKALDLLRKAGELAERRGAPKVNPDHVLFAQDDIERDRMKEYCQQLPLQQKTILLSIYHMQKYRPKEEIITGDIYNCYCEVQSLVPELTQLSQRRVSELIRELDLAGIINARVVSRGKYGRTKFIKLNIDIEDVPKYFLDDKQLSDLIDYVPKYVKNDGKMTRYKGQSFRRINYF